MGNSCGCTGELSNKDPDEISNKDFAKSNKEAADLVKSYSNAEFEKLKNKSMSDKDIHSNNG